MTVAMPMPVEQWEFETMPTTQPPRGEGWCLVGFDTCYGAHRRDPGVCKTFLWARPRARQPVR